MAITPDPEPLTEAEADERRNNWKLLLESDNVSSAFKYTLSSEVLSANSYELHPAAIAVIFAAETTSLRIYPAATNPVISAIGEAPVFTPLIRAIREDGDAVEFSDYYVLAPVQVGSSQARTEKGENRSDVRIEEITAARRDSYRLEWTAKTGEAQKRAFINNEGVPLNYNHFDSQTADNDKPQQDHIKRMIDLAQAAGEETKFYLHLGYDTPQPQEPPADTDNFGYRSVLEMRDAAGNSLNFQYGRDCPPWCNPPQ